MRVSSAETKRRLIEANIAYVRAIAARIKEHLPRDIEFDDLVAYGTQGLIEAAERFDGKHGASFTTYAYYRVRGAIFDGLRRMGWLPRGEWARARVEERAAAYLGNLAERDAGPYDDSGRTVEDDVRELAAALGGVAAIFIASLTRQDEEQMLDPAPLPQERIERGEVERTVRDVIARLPDKERRLIELYYFEDKTLEEAGAALGLSKSWTSRLHARAIDQLQAGLSARAELVDERAARPPPDGKRRRASSR
jgi:RNA polymerase sigma factor for flagellar operon FliA